MAMSTEKTLVVNAMCNTYKFLSLGNNTHSCISHAIHKYNNYVITLVCVAARVTPALVDDHCYTSILQWQVLLKTTPSNVSYTIQQTAKKI